MVDFQTQFKINAFKFVSPERTQPATNNRDNYRRCIPHIFSSPRVEPHDCRAEVVKPFCEDLTWETYMFSHGLKKSAEAAKDMHALPQKQEPGSESSASSPPDKLLYTVGKRGTKQEEFLYPRGMAINGEGSIFVADTMNHRIQKFNQCGVFLSEFGSKGAWSGEFNEPCGLALTVDGDVAVADRKNKRVQILDEEGQQLMEFPTLAEPYHIACDERASIVVSTIKGTIEVYKDDGYLQCSFSVAEGHKVNPRAITLNEDEEILVCDPSGKIKYYDFSGRYLHEFETTCEANGFLCQPTSIDIEPLGHVIISDGLNHGMHLFSRTGQYMKELVGVSDGAGAIQVARMGPEGHLVALEYTVNGPHCLKLFRYGACECHPVKSISYMKSLAATPMTF